MTADRLSRNVAGAGHWAFPTRPPVTLLGAGIGHASGYPARDRHLGGGVCHRLFRVDGQFGDQALVDGAQPRHPRVDRIEILLKTGDLIVELRGEATHDLTLGHERSPA